MRFCAACFVVMVVFACGGPSNGASGDDCASLAKSERAEIDKVFQSNQSCTNDDDCGYANQTTKCAFRNTRLVAVAARANIEAAIAKVDREQCLAFEAKGCTIEREPPAEPPRAPSCVQEHCAY